MSTIVIPPTVLAPDDAYAQFKQAEGALLGDVSGLSSAQQAQAGLLAAQKQAADAAQGNVDNAAQAVATDQPLAVQAAQNLVASLAAFIASNTPVPAPPAPPAP